VPGLPKVKIRIEFSATYAVGAEGGQEVRFCTLATGGREEPVRYPCNATRNFGATEDEASRFQTTTVGYHDILPGPKLAALSGLGVRFFTGQARSSTTISSTTRRPSLCTLQSQK
jgi:hypothetical protein